MLADPQALLVRPGRRYVQSGEMNFETEDKEAALEELREAYPAAAVDELDGVTLDLGPWWFNVRPSNTEPVLSMRFEGRTEADVTAYRDLFFDVLRDFAEIDLEAMT